MKHCFLKKQVKPQSPEKKYTVMRLSGNEQKGFHDAVSGSSESSFFSPPSAD